MIIGLVSSPAPWFLMAVAAAVILAADAAVRSWRFPGRVDDPSWMWPRPAPVRSPWPLGPSRPPLGRVAAELARARWVDLTEPTQQLPVVLPRPNEGATLDWSPLAEHAAVDAGRLPLDDVDEWLAVRLSAFDSALLAIDRAERVTLLRGDAFRTVDEEFALLVDGSQQLHAYREWRIGATGEYAMVR